MSLKSILSQQWKEAMQVREASIKATLRIHHMPRSKNRLKELYSFQDKQT